MAHLVGQLIEHAAKRHPERIAIRYGDRNYSYATLASEMGALADNLVLQGLPRSGRVAVYSEKRPEAAVGMFAAATAGGVFVPVNPLLKADQLTYILRDCNVHTLITTSERLSLLISDLASCNELKQIVVIGKQEGQPKLDGVAIHDWDAMCDKRKDNARHLVIDNDMAAILYTSGSTGKPKGVVLSHRNIVAGARSVAQYLELCQDDRLLSVLPLSFDYGLNQLTSAFSVGASAVLHNHLFPRDVITAVQRERITGLAAVPPLWIQLSELEWPAEVQHHLRYITNSGGHMPLPTLQRLRASLPTTRPYLMYGLTEAFRSTYLPPEELDRRPGSIGKAIPNAEILVVREDGTLCEPDEPGELVHRGVHVSLGYWNDPEKTAIRFKPVPMQTTGLTIPELAVWSGDTVRYDRDGYLYFVGRRDEMIKTSGYRVSPNEIEEVINALPGVAEVAAFGVEHPKLGQAIAVVVRCKAEPGAEELNSNAIQSACQKKLPSYMVPSYIEVVDADLPRNANGKIDRKQLAHERTDLFTTNTGKAA